MIGALGPLWNAYIVLVHATVYGGTLLLLLPLISRAAPSTRAAVHAAVHAAVLAGTLLVSLLCFMPIGAWWAWLLPESVSAPLFWLGATGVGAREAAQGAFASRVNIATALYTLWLAGSAVLLVRLAMGWAVMYVVARRASDECSAEWRSLLRDASSDMGTGQVASLRFSRAVNTPMVWGWLDPIIVLPLHARSWPLEQARIVLLHELAHVRRGDAAVQMIAALARAWYWFHPAVLLSAQALRSAREDACDALVLARGVKRSDYAACLLRVADEARSSGITLRDAPAAALAMAQGRGLQRRVERVLASPPMPDSASRAPERLVSSRGARLTHAALAVCLAWAMTMGTVRLAPRRSVAVAALSSRDWATRGYAAWLLGRTKSSAIRAALAQHAANDPSAVVRRIARSQPNTKF